MADIATQNGKLLFNQKVTSVRNKYVFIRNILNSYLCYALCTFLSNSSLIKHFQLVCYPPPPQPPDSPFSLFLVQWSHFPRV